MRVVDDHAFYNGVLVLPELSGNETALHGPRQGAFVRGKVVGKRACLRGHGIGRTVVANVHTFFFAGLVDQRFQGFIRGASAKIFPCNQAQFLGLFLQLVALGTLLGLAHFLGDDALDLLLELLDLTLLFLDITLDFRFLALKFFHGRLLLVGIGL